jgi:integrase
MKGVITSMQIQRPFLEPRGGIQFRDKKTLKSLQVTSVQTHIVNGKKEQPRLTGTVKLGEFSDQKTFDSAFDKAFSEAKRKKMVMDVEVSKKSTALFNKAKVATVGTFGNALDALWEKQYSNQEQGRNVKSYVKDVLNYFPKEKKLNSFTIEEIDDFKEHMFDVISKRTHVSSGTVANSSINKRLGIIRETFRYALKHRLMGSDDCPNPDTRLKNMGVEDLSRSAPAHKPVLDPQQESSLIQAARDADNSDYADALILLFDTGMRHDGEINVVTIDCVDFKTGQLVFARRKTGGNISVIPLTKRSLEVCKRRSRFALANGGRMFTFTRSQLRHNWDRYKKLAGLPEKFTSYCTRHTCCTRLVEQGLPANVVKDWMGHASIITSLTYYARSTSKMLDKAKNALEGYNQECDATTGDTISPKNNVHPLMGHNSRNRKLIK